MQNSAAQSQSLSPYIFIPYRTGGTAPYAVGEDARIPLHCSKEVKEFRMQNSAALSETLSPYIFIPYRTGGTAPYAVGEDARIPLHCSKEVREI
jgi:hypothetical protein